MNKLFIFLLSLILIFNFSVTSFATSTEEYELALPTSSVALGEDSLVKLDLTCKSAILIEPLTGKVIYEKNSHEKLAPASVTKVMALLLIMEAIDSGQIKLDDTVVASSYACSMGGSQIFLKENEEMSVQDMLKSVIVSSANDCTVALGEHIAGSSEAFVGKMNEKAKELGMQDTYFINSTGLDADGHYTSANDIAVMSKALITKHPTILNYSKIWMDTVRDGAFGLANTNKMIRYYKGADGLKTGSTSNALFCLSTTAERDGLRFIAVIMGAETSKVRFNEATKLLDYGFMNYKSQIIAKPDADYGQVKVAYGNKAYVDACVLEDKRILISKTEAKNITSIVKLEEKVIAPISKGQRIGELEIKSDNKIIATIPLLAKEEVVKVSYFEIYQKFCQKLFNV